MKIFVQGDRYFQPEVVIPRMEKNLEDLMDRIEFDSVKLPYPIDHLELRDGESIPSGMAWDQNLDEDYGSQGVREYYGRNDTLKGLLKDAEILVIHGAALPASVIDEAQKLKLICGMRGGPVNIALDYAKSKGILCCNSPGKNAEAVAEYTVAFILSHIRHIAEGVKGIGEDQYIQRYGDYDVLGYELAGRTIGLVGFGRIAQRLCSILLAFGMKVLAYDPALPEEVIRECGAVPADMETLLKDSDIVSIHARAKEKLITRAQLALMKDSALLVNTARGNLVDYPALYEALKEKRIAGAVLDVLGPEPYEFYRKMNALENVTITPHMAGTSRETVLRGVDMICEDIRNFMTGRDLRYPM